MVFAEGCEVSNSRLFYGERYRARTKRRLDSRLSGRVNGAKVATDEEELQNLLLVLRATVGVHELTVFPKAGFDPTDFNKNYISCRLFDTTGKDELMLTEETFARRCANFLVSVCLSALVR